MAYSRMCTPNLSECIIYEALCGNLSRLQYGADSQTISITHILKAQEGLQQESSMYQGWV